MSEDQHQIIMEELLRFFESQVEALNAQRADDSYCSPNSSYTSAIRFHGRPILPPVMTPFKREEMQMYKHQAIVTETRIRAKMRQRLLARVQAVMKDIEERNTPAPRLESSYDVDVPPLDGLQETEVVADEGESARNKISPTACVLVADADNNQSPRTITKDSGMYSDGQVSGDTVTSSLAQEEFDNDEKLDTMADVTDLSTSEVSEDETSETTTVEHLQRTITEDGEDSDTELSDQSESAATDTEISKECTQSDKITSDDVIDTVIQQTKSDAVREEDVTGQGQAVEIEDNEVLETSSPAEDDPSGSSENTQQPFGSRQRVDHLVKQLDSVLRYHEQNRPLIGQSIPSTSSSATTLSSEEMNRTVIAKEDAIQNMENKQLVATIGENESTTDADTIEAVSDGESRSQSKSSEEHRLDDSSLSSAQLEVSSDSMRASLLSKVVLDTPEGTSEELSEQEGPQVHKTDPENTTPVSRHAPVSLVTEVRLVSDVASPGPTNTPDLSNISHISDDSRPDAQGMSPITAALKLGGKLPLTKVTKKLLMERKESAESSPHDTTASSASPKTDSPCIKSISTTDAFVKSDASHLYTASTELEAYMATSNDTMASSVTTLPYTREPSSGENTGKQTATPEGDAQSSAKSSSNSTPSNETNHQGTGSSGIGRHIRRSSYTLEQPSPILVAAHAKQNGNSHYPTDSNSPKDPESRSLSSDKENKPPSHTNGKRAQNFNLTSSMEDLKLKPVHRKLDYVEASEELPKPILKKSTVSPSGHAAAEPSPSPLVPEAESDTEGKEEHLQRYLEHLSQMPVYHQPTSNPQIVPQYSPLQDDMSQSADMYQPITQDQYGRQSVLSAPEPLGAQGNMEAAQAINMEEMLHLQMQYFEAMKQQMLQRQQQQLAQMFAEQERQQLLLQHELMHKDSKTDPQSRAAQQQRQSQEQNHHQQFSQNNLKYAAVLPNGSGLSSNPDTSVLYEPYDRPYSVPTPRVSFALGPEDTSTRKSPAGVYCNQNFPMSPKAMVQDSIMSVGEEADVPVSRDVYRSPAVLRQRQASQNQSYEEPSPYHQPQHPHPIKQPHCVHYTSPDAYQISHLTHLTQQELPPSLQQKLNKLSAAVKGFLTRKLMKTEKVQLLIKTIRDTAEFALHFQQETPIKKGIYSHQDKNLQERVLAQLTAAMYEIHEIFFEMTTRDRMTIIHQSRLLEQERLFKSREASSRSRRISTATKKALDRKKKAKAAEAIVFGQPRPKSCPPNTSSPRVSRNIDLSPRRELPGGLKKQTTPRKPGALAVKRMQNKGRPSTAAGKKPNRKPVVLPSTKKVVKDPNQPSPSDTASKLPGGSTSQQSGKMSRLSNTTDSHVHTNGTAPKHNGIVQHSNKQVTKQENIDAKRPVNHAAAAQRNASMNNHVFAGISSRIDSRMNAPSIHKRPNPQLAHQANNLQNNELNRQRPAPKPQSITNPTSQPPATRKNNQSKMVRHTSQSKSTVQPNSRPSALHIPVPVPDQQAS